MPPIVPADPFGFGVSPSVQLVGAQAARLGIDDGGVYALRIIKKIATQHSGSTSWLVGINGRVIRAQSNVPFKIGDAISVGASLRGHTVFLHILTHADGEAIGGRVSTPPLAMLTWNSLHGYIVAAAQRSGFTVPRSLFEKLHRTATLQQGLLNKNILPSVGALVERGLFPETINALWYFRDSTETFGRGHRDGRRWQHHTAHKANMHQADESNGNDLDDSSTVETVGTQQRQSFDYSHDQSNHHSNRHANFQSDYHPTELPSSEEHQTALPNHASQWDYIDNDAHSHSIERHSPLVDISRDDDVDRGVQKSHSHDTTPTDSDNLQRSGQKGAIYSSRASHASRVTSDTQRSLHDMKILQNHLLPIMHGAPIDTSAAERPQTGHWVLLPFTVVPHRLIPDDATAVTDTATDTTGTDDATATPPLTEDADRVECSGELHLHYHPTTHQCTEGIIKCTIHGSEIAIHVSNLHHNAKNIFIKTDNGSIAQRLSTQHAELEDAYRKRSINIKSIQYITAPTNQSAQLSVADSPPIVDTERTHATQNTSTNIATQSDAVHIGKNDTPPTRVNTKA